MSQNRIGSDKPFIPVTRSTGGQKSTAPAKSSAPVAKGSAPPPQRRPPAPSPGEIRRTQVLQTRSETARDASNSLTQTLKTSTGVQRETALRRHDQAPESLKSLAGTPRRAPVSGPSSEEPRVTPTSEVTSTGTSKPPAPTVQSASKPVARSDKPPARFHSMGVSPLRRESRPEFILFKGKHFDCCKYGKGDSGQVRSIADLDRSFDGFNNLSSLHRSNMDADSSYERLGHALAQGKGSGLAVDQVLSHIGVRLPSKAWCESMAASEDFQTAHHKVKSAKKLPEGTAKAGVEWCLRRPDGSVLQGRAIELSGEQSISREGRAGRGSSLKSIDFDHTRGTDAEAKLLKYIDAQLDGVKDKAAIRGKINVLTNYKTCLSCCNVYKQLKAKYPNIEFAAASPNDVSQIPEPKSAPPTGTPSAQSMALESDHDEAEEIGQAPAPVISPDRITRAASNQFAIMGGEVACSPMAVVGISEIIRHNGELNSGHLDATLNRGQEIYQTMQAEAVVAVGEIQRGEILPSPLSASSAPQSEPVEREKASDTLKPSSGPSPKLPPEPKTAAVETVPETAPAKPMSWGKPGSIPKFVSDLNPTSKPVPPQSGQKSDLSPSLTAPQGPKPSSVSPQTRPSSPKAEEQAPSHDDDAPLDDINVDYFNPLEIPEQTQANLHLVRENGATILHAGTAVADHIAQALAPDESRGVAVIMGGATLSVTRHNNQIYVYDSHGYGPVSNEAFVVRFDNIDAARPLLEHMLSTRVEIGEEVAITPFRHAA